MEGGRCERGGGIGVGRDGGYEGSGGGGRKKCKRGGSGRVGKMELNRLMERCVFGPVHTSLSAAL